MNNIGIKSVQKTLAQFFVKKDSDIHSVLNVAKLYFVLNYIQYNIGRDDVYRANTRYCFF